MKAVTLAKVYFVAALLLFASSVVQAQVRCIGCTWIEVSPTGKTLICIMLSSGDAYCEVQQP